MADLLKFFICAMLAICGWYKGEKALEEKASDFVIAGFFVGSVLCATAAIIFLLCLILQ